MDSEYLNIKENLSYFKSIRINRKSHTRAHARARVHIYNFTISNEIYQIGMLRDKHPSKHRYIAILYYYDIIHCNI